VTLPAFDGSSRTISLEPSLSPSQNLERLFRQARRAREGARRIAPRLTDALQRRAALEAARCALSSSQVSPAQLQEVAALLEAPSSTRSSARRRAALSGPRRPYRSFQLTEGIIAKVGRSARDNDALTFHHAKGNDLWLHTRDVAGCHVVVPQPGKDLSVPHEVLLDAAHLAVWFSPARHAARADVRYALRKHVRKPGRGAAAGLVHVSHERVIHIVIDPARMQRLLGSEVAST
ncbi:MAG: NFACT RNA binding domain-containing protein, partial [Candidatus Limnocylindrus sp.]